MVALLLVASGLRLYPLGARALWIDEIFTARFAAPGRSFLEVARGPLNSPLPTPPLWFWITHIGLMFWGASDFAVRLPSAFAGIVGVAALYRMGASLFRDRRVGLVGACLLAISPTALHYAREARFYAVIPLLGLLSSYCLHRELRESSKIGDQIARTGSSPWLWVAFTLTTLLSLYIHLTAFFILAAQCAYVGGMWLYERLRHRQSASDSVVRFLSPRYRSFLICLIIVTLCYIPMTPYLWRGARSHRGLGGGREAVDELNLTPRYILDMFAFFGGGRGVPLTLYAGAALWAVINTWRRHTWWWVFFLLMLGVPYLMLFIIQPKHWFAYKYVITLLPLYLLTVAVGLSTLSQTVVEILPLSHNLLLTILALGYGGIVLPVAREVYLPRPGAERWQTLAQVLDANVGEDDVVAYLPVMIETMSPAEVTAHYNPEALGYTTIVNVAEIEEMLARHQRVWVVEDRNIDLDRAGTLMKWLNTQASLRFSLPGPLTLHYLGSGATDVTLLSEAEALPYLIASMSASIADRYAALDMSTECIANLERASTLEPKNGKWPYRLALYYDEWGAFEAAERAYRHAIDLSPEEPRYYAALGALYARNERSEAAVAAYQEAVDLYLAAPPSAKRAYYITLWRNALMMLGE
jgi:hypothetical protein